jgi:hypothetical protein
MKHNTVVVVQCIQLNLLQSIAFTGLSSFRGRKYGTNIVQYSSSWHSMRNPYSDAIVSCVHILLHSKIKNQFYLFYS